MPSITRAKREDPPRDTLAWREDDHIRSDLIAITASGHYRISRVFGDTYANGVSFQPNRGPRGGRKERIPLGYYSTRDAAKAAAQRHHASI